MITRFTLSIVIVLACFRHSSFAGDGIETSDEDTPISLQLAYDQPKLFNTIAPTPGGRHVAFVVRHVPADVDIATSGWFTENDVPISVSGTRIHISDVKEGATSLACDNGGNSWRPSWSPDGRMLAFYSDADGLTKLWVYNLTSGTCRKISEARIFPRPWVGDGPQWSPDSKLVYVPLVPAGKPVGYYYAANTRLWTKDSSADLVLYASGAEVPADSDKARLTTKRPRSRQSFLDMNNAGIASIEISSGETRILIPAQAQPRPNVVRVSPSGNWVSLLSVWQMKNPLSSKAFYDLSIAKAQGGKQQTIARDIEMPIQGVFTGVYAWRPGKDQLVFFKKGKLFLVNFDANGPRKPVQIADGLGELAQGIHWFTRDGKAIVVGLGLDRKRSTHLNSPAPTALAIVPLNGGPVKTIAFDFDKWAYEGLIKADARRVWQPDGASLTVKLRDMASNEVVLMRYRIKDGSAKELWRGRASIRVGDFSASAGDKTLFGSYEDLNTPRDVYRFDSSFSAKKRLSHIAPELDKLPRSKAETFTTQAPMHDHSFLTARTSVILPANHKDGMPLPAIILFYPDLDLSRQAESYGGGSAYGVPAQIFTSRGYAVLYAHVKTGPGDKPGNVINEMVDSLLPQIYRAAEKGLIDPTRLALHGNSFGGFASAAIVTQTNLFRAAIPINGIYDLPGYAYSNAPYGEIGWTESLQPRMGNHLWAEKLRYIENSPMFLADKIKTPLLILQGGADRLRPEAEKFFTALKRLDKPAQLAIYEGAGHEISVWPLKQAIAGTERILSFIEKHLGRPGKQKKE